MDLGWASTSEVEQTAHRCTTESRHATGVTYSLKLVETIEGVIYRFRAVFPVICNRFADKK